jgi:uncharacterized membrane protein YecN with MAPEG domain
MTPVPVTLAAAAASVIVNIWLGSRIVALRKTFKVSVGDGGHEPLLRRMRAQANFIENAPFVLILVGGLELSGASRWTLLAIAVLFVLARIAHAVGMDGGEGPRWRMYGMMGSTLATAALTIWALACAGGEFLSR